MDVNVTDSLSIIFKFYCGGHDLLMETGVPFDNQ
jgi:hypothetical protein